MQKTKPESVIYYFNAFLTHKKAENLLSITIARCICFITIKVVGHNKNSICHCFKCQVCRMLISVLVKRKRVKLLLFVNNKNYNTIYNEELLKSYDI